MSHGRLLFALAPSACKHTVSGSLSLPSRGSFHRSLTVLFAIGHQVVFRLRRWSSLFHTGFLVSCATPDSSRVYFGFDYGAFTLSRLPFQVSSSTNLFPMFQSLPQTDFSFWFGLLQFRSPLLSQSFFYFLFLQVLRCFSSLSSPRLTMYSSNGNVVLPTLCSHIRISTDLQICAPPRSFSQLITSFFGAQCQGIHHMLFVA